MSDFEDYSNLDPDAFASYAEGPPGATAQPASPGPAAPPQAPSGPSPAPSYVGPPPPSTAPPYTPGGDVWVGSDGAVASPYPQGTAQSPSFVPYGPSSAPVASPTPSQGSANAAAGALLIAALAGAAGFYKYGFGGAAAGVALSAGALNVFKAPDASDASPEAQSERGRALLAAAADFALGGWVLYHLIKDHGHVERR